MAALTYEGPVLVTRDDRDALATSTPQARGWEMVMGAAMMTAPAEDFLTLGESSTGGSFVLLEQS